MKQSLIEYIKDSKFFKLAEVSFWKSLDGYKIEEQEEYLQITDNKSVSIILNTISYKVFMDSHNQDVVIIKYNIYCEKKIIGDYSFIIDFINKTPIDDYLVFR